MKRWSFGFRVREWFLTTRDWDQLYEPGDHREVVTMFYADSPDVELAKQKLHKDAETEEVMLEIIGLEYCQEVEMEMPQKPIGQPRKL